MTVVGCIGSAGALFFGFVALCAVIAAGSFTLKALLLRTSDAISRPNRWELAGLSLLEPAAYCLVIVVYVQASDLVWGTYASDDLGRWLATAVVFLLSTAAHARLFDDATPEGTWHRNGFALACALAMPVAVTPLLLLL